MKKLKKTYPAALREKAVKLVLAGVTVLEVKAPDKQFVFSTQKHWPWRNRCS